jgi:hypothetical protein
MKAMYVIVKMCLYTGRSYCRSQTGIRVDPLLLERRLRQQRGRGRGGRQVRQELLPVSVVGDRRNRCSD